MAARAARPLSPWAIMQPFRVLAFGSETLFAHFLTHLVGARLGRAQVSCSCYCTVTPMLSVVLLLLISLPFATSVCRSCFGEAAGCTDSGVEHCPWNTGVAANAAALAAGTALTVASLLPSKILRLFHKSVLETISALELRTTTSFDCSGKSFPEILEAVRLGRASKDDAIGEISAKAAAFSGADLLTKLEVTKMQIAAIDRLNPKMRNMAGFVEGAMLYVLYKLSSAYCSVRTSSASFDVCLECEPASSSSSNPRTFSSSLVRPANEGAMYSLLNAFVATCHSLALASVHSTTSFLEDVVYEPVRVGVLHWTVAFECMVLYLRKLESFGSRGVYTLGTIFARSGGIDSIRAEAAAIAKESYPAAFFRSHGGNPSELKPSGNGEIYKGSVKGNSSAKASCCHAWNNGAEHLAKHVGPDGVCKFRHVCSFPMPDKPGGVCGGDHRKTACPHAKAAKSGPEGRQA